MRFFLALIMIWCGLSTTSALAQSESADVKSVVRDEVAPIKVKAIKTDYGLKVYFGAIEHEYVVSFDKQVATILFTNQQTFDDANSIKRAWDKVHEVVIQDRAINIFLDISQARIIPFTDGNLRGFTIYDQALQEVQNDENVIHEMSIGMQYQMGLKDNVLLTFDWPVDVAAAVYGRGDNLWVVFNKASKYTISNETDLPSPTLQATPTNATIVSFKIEKFAENFTGITAHKKGNNWDITLRKQKPHNNEIVVIAKPYASPLPKVDIKFPTLAVTPINFTDPILGDDLIVMPCATSAFGISVERRFVDFRILKSAQGAVLRKNTETVFATSKNDATTILNDGARSLILSAKSADSGGKRTEEFERQATSRQETSVKNSILSLMNRYVGNAPLIENLQILQQAVVLEEDAVKRMSAYHNLVVFFLANGLFKEAALITNILQQQDVFTDDYINKLLKGLILFYSEDYVQANSVLKAIDLMDVPNHQHKEILFWQTITSAAVWLYSEGDFIPKVDMNDVYLDENNSFIVEYPDYLRLKMGYIITEKYLKDRNVVAAERTIKLLETMPLENHDKNHLLMLQGKLSNLGGNINAAVEKWDKCMEDASDGKHRAMCMRLKADAQWQNQKIAVREYTQTLEHVSIIWQGGEFERSVLKDLGDTYHANQDYINALRAWKRIADYYPYSAQAINLTRNIGETFIKFFTSDLDKNVSHVQAVSLFYEFENLVPIGAIGDDIVINFTDHLIALDLLERAAKILEYQASARLKGYKREELINKLAGVYLKMQKPAAAIDIIRIGDLYEELPLQLQQERRYIHATALKQNMEYDKAIDLLHDDNSEKADALYAEIYWEMHNWSQFDYYAEPNIYQLKQNPKLRLSEENIDSILKLTISYSMQSKHDLLQDLVTAFYPRILAVTANNADLVKALENFKYTVDDNSVAGAKKLDGLKKQVDLIMGILRGT
jgi:hypothetical protein